jgi:ribosome-associated protein
MDTHDEILTVTRRIRIPVREFEFTFVRSSGPGGQNVNKTATKAQLRWPVADSPSLPEDVRDRFVKKYNRRITTGGELILTSQRYRYQSRKAADFLEKLRGMLSDVAVPPKPRKKTRPTAGAKRRRLKQKREKSQKKQLRRPPRPEE